MNRLATLLLCLLLCGCVVPPPKPEPPTPVSDVDAKLLQVVIDYAGQCGDSLLDTPTSDVEAQYHAALKSARQQGRLAAHNAEDVMLNEASGDPAKVREIGEAWKRVQKRLEGLK